MWRRRDFDASVEVIFSWTSAKVMILTFSYFLNLGSEKIVIWQREREREREKIEGPVRDRGIEALSLSLTCPFSEMRIVG